MRTTITLDPDVATRVLRLSKERGTSFKETINSVLRVGLDPGVAHQGGAYEERTVSLDVRPDIDLTKALRLAADLEDEAIIRKLELRK